MTKLGERHPEWNNLGARLANYIANGEKKAKAAEIWEEFRAAKTLTRARKILWGKSL